jgi:pyruvate/2-oxoglutarate dehydrogenase complex dihydrolipoamide acyltransferase (E2) component
MRRNVIVSQGGKTGAGGTYLRDHNVSAEAAEHIPPTLIDVTKQPGAQAPAAAPAAAVKPSIQPPKEPTPQRLTVPGSAKALRRWSEPKMARLAKQEGIEAEGLDKDGLRALLTAHFGLK